MNTNFIIAYHCPVQMQKTFFVFWHNRDTLKTTLIKLQKTKENEKIFMLEGP